MSTRNKILSSILYLCSAVMISIGLFLIYSFEIIAGSVWTLVGVFFMVFGYYRFKKLS